MTPRWINTPEQANLLPCGSVILLDGTLAAQLCDLEGGWIIAGMNEGDLRVERLLDDMMPALLVYEGDQGWLNRLMEQVP